MSQVIGTLIAFNALIILSPYTQFFLFVHTDPHIGENIACVANNYASYILVHR